MNHEPEHIEARKPQAPDAELAKAYAAALNGTEEGRKVLRDLQRKFSHRRPRFFQNGTTVSAALIDGQCAVLREIEQAIQHGSKLLGIPYSEYENHP